MKRSNIEKAPFQKIANLSEIGKLLGDEIVISHNFVGVTNKTGDCPINNGCRLKNHIPEHPVPNPILDRYLSIAPIVYPQGKGIIQPPPNGQLEYMAEIGQLSEQDYKNNFVSLERCNMSDDLEQQLLEIQNGKKAEIQKVLEGKILMPIFSSEISKVLANRYNMELLNDRKTVFQANHKGALRKNAEKYNFRVAPGMEIDAGGTTDVKDINNIFQYIVNTLAKVNTDMWLKFPTGSGGDLVVRLAKEDFQAKSKEEINKILMSKVKKLCLDIKKSAFGGYEDIIQQQGFKINDISHEEIYLILMQRGLVVEENIEDMEQYKIIGNYNLQAVISDNSITPYGISEQRTNSAGEYLGNLLKPIEEYDAEILNLCNDQLYKTAEYIHNEYDYKGVIGIDIIMAEDKTSGEKIPFVIDVNSRLNGSTSSVLIQNHLQVPYVLNTNIQFATIPKDFNEVRELIGENNLFNGQKNIGVYPKMLREGTNVMKVDILGENMDDIEKIIKIIAKKAIKISS